MHQNLRQSAFPSFSDPNSKEIGSQNNETSNLLNKSKEVNDWILN